MNGFCFWSGAMMSSARGSKYMHNNQQIKFEVMPNLAFESNIFTIEMGKKKTKTSSKKSAACMHLLLTSEKMITSSPLQIVRTFFVAVLQSSINATIIFHQ